MKKLKHFELFISLGASLEARGGDTPEQAAEGRYRTKANAPRSLFEELMGKLIVAIHDQSQTIDVNLQNDKWIIKD